MNKNLSFKQRLHNAIGSQEIEQIKAVHAYTHATMYSREEWDRIWYMCDATTWAHGFGRMVGGDQVYDNSVRNTDNGIVRHNLDMQIKYPELRGTDLRSAGKTGIHALAEGVIEVAEDGGSARSYYLTPGTMLDTFSPSGRRSGGWLWERYGSDFVCVDGEWLYLHEQVCPDFGSKYGTENWGHDAYMKIVANEPERPLHGPPVTDPGPLHQDYTVVMPVQNTVPPPVPYKTLDDNNSYSPGRNNYKD